MWKRPCLLVLLVICACGSPYGVSASTDAEWFKRETPTALDSPHLSYRTRQYGEHVQR